MILDDITVKNWRAYREPRTFHFEDGINLVIGRNEAGKSTLFEALTRALFDRHSSKTEEIRAMQPLCSSLGPEVTIHFRTGGIRYKVVKRFLQDPRSELYSERNGRWELNFEGDASDNRLREILSGEGTSRTAARPEHRGLAQALWYLQSDGAIPEKEWNSGVKQGLQGLVEMAARSPKERAILKQLDEAYSEYWTPTGRITTTSELGNLLAQIPIMEDDISKLRDRARTVEGYRNDLEEFQNLEGQKKFELQQAEKDLSSLDEQVRAGEALAREREAMERARNEADQKADGLQKELAEIKDRQKKNTEMRKEIQNVEVTVSEVTDEAREQSEASERHARRWKEELEPILKGIDGELSALRASSHLLELEKERIRLEKHLKKASEIRRQLEDAMKMRSAIVAPDTKERKRFAKIEEELSVLDAKIEASAVRVAFEWQGKGRTVTTLPELVPANGSEFIVTEPTEFFVRGMGRIRIRTGAQALKDLVAEKDQAQLKRQRILGRYAAEDAEGLATLQEKARELDRTVSKLEALLEDADEAEPDAERKLARVKLDIEQETSCAGQLSSNFPEPCESSIGDLIASKEKEKKRLIGDIEGEQELEKDARQRHLDLIKAREAKSSSLAGYRAQVRTYEETIAKSLEIYGTLDHLERLVTDSKVDFEKIEASLGKLMDGYEERVETPRRLQEQAVARTRELDEHLGKLRTKVAETMARIEEAAAQGNYSQLADSEIDIERKKRRAWDTAGQGQWRDASP